MMGLPRKDCGSGGVMRGRRPKDMSRWTVEPGFRLRAVVMRIQMCARRALSFEMLVMVESGEEMARV